MHYRVLLVCALMFKINDSFYLIRISLSLPELDDLRFFYVFRRNLFLVFSTVFAHFCSCSIFSSLRIFFYVALKKTSFQTRLLLTNTSWTSWECLFLKFIFYCKRKVQSMLETFNKRMGVLDILTADNILSSDKVLIKNFMFLVAFTCKYAFDSNELLLCFSYCMCEHEWI